jgi:hypothetical protein
MLRARTPAARRGTHGACEQALRDVACPHGPRAAGAACYGGTACWDDGKTSTNDLGVGS